MKSNLQKITSSMLRKAAISLVLFLSFNILVIESQALPFLSATKTDTLIVDNDGDDIADPGDTIRYTTIITQSGTTRAGSVVFLDTLDPNTSLVAGSIRITPIARNDGTYESLGNVGITVPAVSGVLSNDEDPDGSSVSVIPNAGGTANGGAFAIGSNGAFSYLPPTGFEGTDSFSYSIQDTDGNQDPATVFIVVTEMIWFIDNSAPSPGGGGLFTPFNSLSDFNAIQTGTAPGAKDADIVFLYSGTGNYNNGILMRNGQTLIGQGATASIEAITGITVPPYSNALPTTGGSKPTIANAGGDGITLASGNLVRGLTVSNSGDAGLTGSGVNTLTVQEVNVTNATGNGIHLTNISGTSTFDNLSVTGSSARNVLIENNTGTATINVTNSVVNNAGSDGFAVIGSGSANLTFNVSNSTFTHNIAVQLKAHAEDSSNVNVSSTNNDFDGEPLVVGNVGVDVAARDNATLSFLINNNNFQPFRSQVANVFASGGGMASGSINGNTILGSTYGAGVRAVAEVTTGGNPSLVIDVSNNNISNIEGFGLAGIDIRSRQGVIAANGTADVQATVNNNAVGVTNTADANIQFFINSGNTLCAAVSNNVASGTPVFGDAFYVGNPVVGDPLGPGTAQLSGWTGDIDTTWNNNGNTPLNSAFLDGTINGSCTPPTPTAFGYDNSELAQLPGDHEGGRRTNPMDKNSIGSLWQQVYEQVGGIFSGLVENTGHLVSSFIKDSHLQTAHASGETVNLSLGDLDPGQVVEITFDVTIDNPQSPANNPQVCNQGLISGINFSDVLTDDPEWGGSIDPTCTILDYWSGSLTVMKLTEGGDDTFNFESSTLPFASFNITTSSGTGSFPITNLIPGTYDITEIVPYGWDLITSYCSNDDDPSAVDVNPGDNVICTFENLFNQAPVTNGDSYTATEDTTLNVTAPGVLANDSDPDGDSITAFKDSDPSHGSLTFNSSGSFSYESDANYCGSDSFTYHANDGMADSNIATVSIDVVCVDDPPEVSVDVTSQTVQYSDYIAPVTVTATDVDSDPLTIRDDAFSALSTTGSCTADGSGTSCSWTLSGQVLISAGTNTVTFTVSDQTSDVTASTEIVVEPENAKATFDGGNPIAVPVSNPGGTSEPFTLTVLVQEAPETGADTAAGDINLADVSLALEPIGPGSPVTMACTPTGAVTAYDYGVSLTVECNFTGVEVNAYVAAVTVNGGFYTGSGEDSLVVYDPSLGFTTGGGWFYWPGTDDRTTFGYTMKYNKKATKVQGSLILIRHLDDGSVFRLKSNAIDGLALGEETDFGWASFSGKATYMEPGWADAQGNHTFTIYVEDHGEPGDMDRIWIEVKDKDGIVIANLSMTPDATANSVLLDGGNIVVPHSNNGSGNNK